MDTEKFKQQFIEQYGGIIDDVQVYFSPGRVNLIGEHTDYNGGYVFPCALSYGTYLVVRKTAESNIKFASLNFDYKQTISLDKLSEKQGSEWVNYPLGVINQLIALDKLTEGLELLYSGNIPNGAGLSSSASIEVLTAFALNDLYGYGISMIDLVKLSQKAENQFVGVNCGIMDQFAVGMGKQNHALFLNCETLDYELIPLVLTGYKIVISNTNKRRGLADSKYNERRAECDKAVEYLNSKKNISLLGEIDYPTFLEIQDTIPDEIVKNRARHVISENQRVLEAIDALKANDLTTFGKLMNASHDSLRDDYEVTGIELDTLVEEARKVEGVIGSRMTGAGFGGCTVSLVRDDVTDKFCKAVGKNYKAKTGLEAEFYIADIGDGARKID